MRRLFQLIARAARREDVPTIVEGVITSTAPVTAVLDTDPGEIPREVDAAWHPVIVGQRVRIEALHGTLTIIATKPTDWVTIPPLPGVEVTNDSPAQVIADGGSIHMRGNLAIPAGITDGTWLDLCEIPAPYRPARFVRHANGGYATASEYAPSVIGVDTSGLVKIGRAGGPAGAATITTAYLDLTWPRA